MQKESCKVYIRHTHTPSVPASQLYYYPQYAGRFVCNSDFLIERRDFSSILVLYTRGGSAMLKYRGREYSLTPRSIALIDCRDEHIYYPEVGCEWDFDFIHFGGQSCFEIYRHIYTLNGSPILDGTAELCGNIKDCIRLCEGRQPHSEILMSKYLSEFLHSCLLQIQGSQKEIFPSVCGYIKKHYASITDTAVLAGRFGFSRSYFSVQFKKYTGITVHEYILCCRLDAAKEMLLDTVMSIEHIAQKTGFCDTGTFIRAFKRKENCTPSKYRKLISKLNGTR